MSLLRRVATVSISLTIAALSGALSASAHGTFESNLAAQTFDQAPAAAEFTAAVPVLLDTAKARLRYLGTGEISADSYFAKDVPTVELELVGPATGTAETFAFTLPSLAAGSYALDWEVTPEGDHVTESVQLFEVTVGDPNPDPTPAALAPGGSDSATATPAETAGTSPILPLIGGVVFLLVVSGIVVAVVRARKGGQG